MERSGYRIPPYRLACMAKTAAKILQAVSEGGPVAYTLSEARLGYWKWQGFCWKRVRQNKNNRERAMAMNDQILMQRIREIEKKVCFAALKRVPELCLK